MSLADEARRALKAYREKYTPKEMFDQMVRKGLIDKEGRVTVRYGGTAEVDPSAEPEETL